MFELRDFSVAINNKKIIKKINLKVGDGETHVIMGPNGSGKSTLAKALLGHPLSRTMGSIIIDDEDISNFSTDQRAKKGLFLAFQHPEEIEGVSISNFMRKARSSSLKNPDVETMLSIHKQIEKNALMLGLNKEFVKRDINTGFSGGEKKRMEMLQALSLKPRILVFDEIDSGLDVDGIRLIAKAIESLGDGKRSFILITHYPRMLKYLKIDKVHILVEGVLVETGGQEVAQRIENEGYSSYTK